MIIGVAGCDDPNEEDKSFDLEQQIIDNLCNHLYHLTADHEMDEDTLHRKLNDLIYGQNLMYVEFDSEEYFFACAYYDGPKYEYQNAKRFIWRGYNNPSDIKETYDDVNIYLTFQINKSSKKIDLLTNQPLSSNVLYYQSYPTEFLDGYNINKPLINKEKLLYIVYKYEDYVFCSKQYFAYRWISFDLVEENDILYIKQGFIADFENGQIVSSRFLEIDFKEYYDELMSMMIIPSEFANSSGEIDAYGLFKIDDIVDLIYKHKAANAP